MRILAWIEIWGTGVGWLIRLGLIVGGVLIFFAFQTKEDREAMEQAHQAEKEEAELDWDAHRSAVRADPRFSEFMTRVNKDYDVSFDAPSNGGTYHIKHYTFTNAMGKRVTPDSNEIANVTIYVQREQDPKRMLIGSPFANGVMGAPQSMEVSGSQWNYFVPKAAVT